MYACPGASGPGSASRLPQGAHLPHPNVTQTTGRRVEVVAAKRGASGARRGVGLEIDGVPGPAAIRVTVEVIPEAFRLVV